MASHSRLPWREIKMLHPPESSQVCSLQPPVHSARQLRSSILNQPQLNHSRLATWATSRSLLGRFWIFLICKPSLFPHLAQNLTFIFPSFAQFQYFHLPILDTDTDIESMQRNTPFLFWTIIMISCRYHHLHHELLPLLRVPYQEFLGRAMVVAPMSLRTIQALLLLCYWPLPCRTQPQDPSWNILGLVLNAAKYQGLNTGLDHYSLKSPTSERQLRSRTWLAVFLVGTS